MYKFLVHFNGFFIFKIKHLDIYPVQQIGAYDVCKRQKPMLAKRLNLFDYYEMV